MNFHLREMSQPSPNFRHGIMRFHTATKMLTSFSELRVNAYREDIALVTSLFRASSFFLRSSAVESSTSS